MEILGKFINKKQLKLVQNLAKNSEEKEHFTELLIGWNKKIIEMPKTYEQDGKGEDAVAHLHYFINGSDFYITEKDIEDEQYQAFGLVSLNGNEPELGYISIKELLDCGVEFDLSWIPKKIKELK